MARASKSPRAVLLAAFATAKRALPLYSRRNSPRKFTQHQLFGCLVLKSFLRTDYRGLAAHLADNPSLLALMELQQVPHLTTFQKASRRMVLTINGRCTEQSSGGEPGRGLPPPTQRQIKRHANSARPRLARDEANRLIRRIGRKNWKKTTGYHCRSRVETAAFRFKTIFGSLLNNRKLPNQITEARLRSQILNRFIQSEFPYAHPN